MKRIIFLFVFGIMSLGSFGHVDTLYLSKDFIAFSYHSNLKCDKIHKIIDTLVVSELTQMNKLTKYNRCHDCISNEMMVSFKETITKNKYNKISRENILSVQNNVQNNEIYKAGIYQQKSAKCNFIALGFAGAAVLTAVIPSTMSEEDNGNGCYVAAGIFGFGALVSEICACSFKLKSGKSLKVAANHIQYNF